MVAVEGSHCRLLDRSESGVRKVIDAVGLVVVDGSLCRVLEVVQDLGRGLCLCEGRSPSGCTRVASLCRRLVEVDAVRCGVTGVVDVRSRAGCDCVRQGRVVSVLMQLVGVCVLMLVVRGRACVRRGCVVPSWCWCWDVEEDVAVVLRWVLRLMTK